MKNIGVGVIGTGFIGPVHIEALRRLGCVTVTALADADQHTADLKAKQLHIGKAFGNYMDLIRDPEVECVHICTPNHLHYEMVKEVLLADKHVVCDKPLALTVKQGGELVALARQSGKVAAVNFNVRFYPLLHHMKEMCESGELGEIFAINGSYQQDWLQKDTDYSWRLEPEKGGESRAVADIGSHWLDCVEFFSGLRISDVCSDFATFYPVRKKPLNAVETYSGKIIENLNYQEVRINTEDYATVLLRFENGAHGSMTVNQVAAGCKNRICFEVYGSKCGVSFNSERPNELWIGRRDGANQVLVRDPSLVNPLAQDLISYPGGHNEGFADTYKQCFRHIYEYILGMPGAKVASFPTIEDGLRELTLNERIIESAHARRWVKAL